MIRKLNQLRTNTVLLKFHTHKQLNFITMAPHKQKNKNGKHGSTKQSNDSEFCVTDASNNILINILAKPGAQQNAVTDVNSIAVSIQIHAKPIDGDANAELLKYLSQLLGIRKNVISLEKGFKSRQKTVKILSDNITLDLLKDKINTALENK